MPCPPRTPVNLKLLGIALATFALGALPLRSQAATNLAFLGTDNPSPFPSFIVDTEFFTTAPYTQGSSTLTLNVPFTGGQTLFGVFGSVELPFSFDWSGEEKIALSLSATLPPITLLTVDFYASDLVSVLASAEVAVGGIGSSPTTVEFDFGLDDSIADLTNVAALFFIWGGDSFNGPPVNTADTAVTIHSIQAVPEPSTYALLLAAGCGLGGWLIRRRR